MIRRKTRVHLHFDPDELYWVAEINGERYATHRWETRAFSDAKDAYIEKKQLPSTPDFEMEIEWPPQMKRALAIARKAEEPVRAAEKALEEARSEHARFVGMYVAGWKDCGMSLAHAVRLAGISINTARKYMEMSGGEEPAAKALWKLIPPPPEKGALGRYSERTNPTGREKNPWRWETVEEDDDSED